VNPDPVAAGLRLLLAAARDARHAAGGLSIQVELSRRLRSGSAGPRDAGGFGIVGRIEDAGQSRRITTAVARRLQDGAPCRDALIDALGPTGEAAAIDGLAWAWRPGRGFHLLRSGPTPAQDAASRWIQRTGNALAHGEWPVRAEDCGSAHARMRRLQAGRWDGAADALAAEWAWNPLLRSRSVLQLRQGQAALWHAQGLQADGPPLVLAAAAW
jgi:hypothetical protein